MRRFIYLFLFFLFICGLILKAECEAAAKPYYEGKTIEILVGSRVGGGTDTMARIISNLMPKYIPGKPNMVIRVMPGASGSIANNIFWEKGKPDGLHLLMNSDSQVGLQMRGRDIVKYNLLDYKQIGNVSRGGNVLLIRKDALGRLNNPKAEPLVCGTKEGEETWMGMVLLGKEILGWNVRWVPGYSGTSDMELGLQRGEVDMLGTSNSFVIDRLKKEGLAIPITQTGTYKQGKFMRRTDYADVPTFVETLGEKKPSRIAWQSYLTFVGPNLLNKFLSAPPKTSQEYVSILVGAFDKMSGDPIFDKMVKKMVSDVYDVNVGAETTAILKEVLDVPQEALDYGIRLQKKFGIIAK